MNIKLFFIEGSSQVLYPWWSNRSRELYFPQFDIPISLARMERFTKNKEFLHSKDEHGISRDASQQNCRKADGADHCTRLLSWRLFARV